MLIESKAAGLPSPPPLLCCLLRAEGAGRILHLNCLPRRKLSPYLHGDRLESWRNAIHYTNYATQPSIWRCWGCVRKGLEFKTLFILFKWRRKRLFISVSPMLMCKTIINCLLGSRYLCDYFTYVCATYVYFYSFIISLYLSLPLPSSAQIMAAEKASLSWNVHQKTVITPFNSHNVLLLKMQIYSIQLIQFLTSRSKF